MFTPKHAFICVDYLLRQNDELVERLEFILNAYRYIVS